MKQYYEEQDAYYNEATSGEGIVGDIQPFPTLEEWVATQVRERQQAIEATLAAQKDKPATQSQLDRLMKTLGPKRTNR